MKESLPQEFAMSSRLFLSEEMSDVTLKVQHEGYSWRFPAHTLLLQSKSVRFREMIEERREHPLSLTLIGMHPDTVLALLKYIYTDELPNPLTADLLISAERLELHSLLAQAEDVLLPSLRVPEAVELLRGLEAVSPPVDGPLKTACYALLEKHAVWLFASDLLLGLERRVLSKLVASDCLNVPDERMVFWGVWRWGRRRCVQSGRSLRDEDVAVYLDDLLVMIRLSCLRQANGIPCSAQRRFNRCLTRRTRYAPPDDSLRQSSSWRTCDAWSDMAEEDKGERGMLCLQVSFSKGVMLTGLVLEMSAPASCEAILRIFRESDHKELVRQKVTCFQSDPSRTTKDPSPLLKLESQIVLSEPLILFKSEIYSFTLFTKAEGASFPRALSSPFCQRVDSTTVTRHGQQVVAVRELYFVPDIQPTWGPMPD